MRIKRGDKGVLVKALQEVLIVKGYLTGKADGSFGQKTEEAVKEVQKEYGLSIDGVVGPWLAAKLKISIPKKTIAITAGHNSKDPGAVNGSYTEAGIVVEVRNEVAKLLRNKGYTVLTDGSGSTNESLSNASKLAKQSDLAIEFHLNAAVSKTAKGVEALASSNLKRICQMLCKATAKELNTTVRGGDGGWKPSNSGQHKRLAFCEAGGIVMELLFISNETELQTFLKNKNALYEALAEAIVKYLEEA